jgi:putative membrane protein
MLLRWLLAALHLLALAIGFGAVILRTAAFRDILDTRSVRRVLYADNWWGFAAFLWLATGLARLFLGTEKPTAYYLDSHLFWTKMGLFLLILLLEIGPMVALIQWRGALRRGETPNTKNAQRYATIGAVEAFLVVLMVFAATALARGFEVVMPR